MSPLLSHRASIGLKYIRSYSQWKTRFPPVTSILPYQLDGGDVGLDIEKPWKLPWYALERIPACEQWFNSSVPGWLKDERVDVVRDVDILHALAVVREDRPSLSLNIPYLKPFGDIMVPLEVTRTQKHSRKVTGEQRPGSIEKEETFERISAPLSLFLAYLIPPHEADLRLYLAQFPLADLPQQLQYDLPTPTIINRIGKGDIYGSSLWMGLTPTYTPLHKDPNHNIFVQLAGSKDIRLIEPREGQKLYNRVMKMLNKSGSSAMRGEDMMVGAEKQAFEEAVWGYSAEEWEDVKGWEARVGSTDALFIPKGWWHSVRGVGEGELNASVNWWFR